MPNTGDIDLRSLGLALLEMADAKPAKSAKQGQVKASKSLEKVASVYDVVYDKIVSKAVELWTLDNPGKNGQDTRKKWTKDVTKGGLSGVDSGIAMRYVVQALNATSRKNGWIKDLPKFDFAQYGIKETKQSYTAEERAVFSKYLQKADAHIKSVV